MESEKIARKCRLLGCNRNKQGSFSLHPRCDIHVMERIRNRKNVEFKEIPDEMETGIFPFYVTLLGNFWNPVKLFWNVS